MRSLSKKERTERKREEERRIKRRGEEDAGICTGCRRNDRLALTLITCSGMLWGRTSVLENTTCPEGVMRGDTGVSPREVRAERSEASVINSLHAAILARLRTNDEIAISAVCRQLS